MPSFERDHVERKLSVEPAASLMGFHTRLGSLSTVAESVEGTEEGKGLGRGRNTESCLLYTSDAADES